MINYSAVHAAFKDYKTNAGSYSTPAIPQPVANGPMHKMIVHAMAMAPNKDGESHGTMVIRALTDHLKRVTPDVNSIHKDESGTQSLAPTAPLMSGQ